MYKDCFESSQLAKNEKKNKQTNKQTKNQKKKKTKYLSAIKFIGKNDSVHIFWQILFKTFYISKDCRFRAISLKFDSFDNICSVKIQTSKSFGLCEWHVNVINNHTPHSVNTLSFWDYFPKIGKFTPKSRHVLFNFFLNIKNT